MKNICIFIYVLFITVLEREFRIKLPPPKKKKLLTISLHSEWLTCHLPQGAGQFQCGQLFPVRSKGLAHKCKPGEQCA